MLIKDRNHKNKVCKFKKVQYFIKVKFRRLLAVIWHCRARIDYKIRKHYSTRFGTTAYYRRTIVSRYILLSTSAHEPHVLFERTNQLSTLVLTLYSHKPLSTGFFLAMFSVSETPVTRRCNTIFEGAVSFRFRAPDSSPIYILNSLSWRKVSFMILRHCCTHWPCWLRTWGGASSLTKTLISQSALYTFAFAFTLVMQTLCVKCRRSLWKGL